MQTATVAGFVLIPIVLLWISLSAFLIVALVMIWKWCRQTCMAVNDLRNAVAVLEKSVSEMSSQTLDELRLLRVTVSDFAEQVAAAATAPTVEAPSHAEAAVCPECGATVEFSGAVSEVDVVCPACNKPFHIH